jgi:hypothetical protein
MRDSGSSYQLLLDRLVKELCNVRINERNDNEHGSDHEQGLVNAASPGNGTNLTWLASLRWSKDASASKQQSNERRGDKQRTIRFKSREISDPRTTQPQCD